MPCSLASSPLGNQVSLRVLLCGGIAMECPFQSKSHAGALTRLWLSAKLSFVAPKALGSQKQHSPWRQAPNSHAPLQVCVVGVLSGFYNLSCLFPALDELPANACGLIYVHGVEESMAGPITCNATSSPMQFNLSFVVRRAGFYHLSASIQVDLRSCLLLTRTQISYMHDARSLLAVAIDQCDSCWKC